MPLSGIWGVETSAEASCAAFATRATTTSSWPSRANSAVSVRAAERGECATPRQTRRFRCALCVAHARDAEAARWECATQNVEEVRRRRGEREDRGASARGASTLTVTERASEGRRRELGERGAFTCARLSIERGGGGGHVCATGRLRRPDAHQREALEPHPRGRALRELVARRLGDLAEADVRFRRAEMPQVCRENEDSRDHHGAFDGEKDPVASRPPHRPAAARTGPRPDRAVELRLRGSVEPRCVRSAFESARRTCVCRMRFRRPTAVTTARRARANRARTAENEPGRREPAKMSYPPRSCPLQ